MYIYYHYTYNIHSYCSLLYNDYDAGILEYPIYSPLVDWQLVYIQ